MEKMEWVFWLIHHPVLSCFFTAIFVSKTIFQYHLAKMDRQGELSI